MSNTELEGVDEEPTPSEEVIQNGLPYISKSRIKKYLQCPRKFFWTYVCQEREPGNFYTKRGTAVHETFETYHENLLDYIDREGQRPLRFEPLLPDPAKWKQWIEMVGEFFRFEERRWKESILQSAWAEAGLPYGGSASIEEVALDWWEPIEIEAEAWLGEPPDSWLNSERGGEPDYVSGEPPVGDAPWMGRADLIVDTQSVPDVEGSGVTIIDYKTGEAPTVKYEGAPFLEECLQEGIYLEGEYYGWLFEEFYDVDAVAGYYPQNDLLLTSTYPNKDRRRDIKRAVLGMQQEPKIENFELDESPLCHWNNDNGEGQCFFHPVCPSRHNCDKCGTETDAKSNASRYDY